MKIDRAAFLAITTTLAVGCAASSGDDNVVNDEAAISAGGDELCYSADESTTGSAKSYWVGNIGFDPVNDFPAAEGFCFDFASTGQKDANGFPEFDSFIYEKCNAYAKVYVPHVAYTSYADLVEKSYSGMPSGEKWGVLYALDTKIAAEDFFCQTSSDRILCRGAADQAACLRAATQMLPEAKEKLQGCMDKWDVYTCIEGTDTLRPHGIE